MLRVLVVGCAVGLLWFGQPARQGEWPDDGFDDRFPLRAEAPKPDAGLAREPPVRVIAPVVPGGRANPCDGVPPQDQLSCPLVGRVTAVERTSQGVRLVVRRGPPVGQLRNQLICQQSQAAVRPDEPPACSFLDPELTVIVRDQGNGTTAVELRQTPPDAAKVGLLQERVETAFPAARRSRR
jgi:hypothetical protein